MAGRPSNASKAAAAKTEQDAKSDETKDTTTSSTATKAETDAKADAKADAPEVPVKDTDTPEEVEEASTGDVVVPETKDDKDDDKDSDKDSDAKVVGQGESVSVPHGHTLADHVTLRKNPQHQTFQFDTTGLSGAPVSFDGEVVTAETLSKDSDKK